MHDRPDPQPVNPAPSDPEVWDWIERTYGDHLGNRMTILLKQVLLDQNYEEVRKLPRDLDMVVQTIQHARACIVYDHDPIAARDNAQN